MWNSINSNQIIGTHIKVQSYKTHLKNLKNIRPQINVENPWKPSFSLSKRKNKYYKFLKNEVDKQNSVLLNHMIQIEGEPMTKTCMNIPLTIPSNKTTYANIKQRQRNHTNHEINKENIKILQKIQRAQSNYGKHVWRDAWKQNKKYKNNITKKEFIPDYSTLVREEENYVHQIQSRPKTANACY